MKNNEKTEKILAAIKFMILLLIMIGLPVVIYFKFPQFIEIAKDRDSLNQFLIQYKTRGIFIYMGLQAFQVVVSVIPGQIIHLTGGYVFGFFPGILFTLVGICVGSIAAFYLARLLGKQAVRTLFKGKHIEKFIAALNSKRAYIILFIVFLIPGMPKNAMSYAAGISEIRLQNFLLICLAGRLPAMMVTISIGKMLYTGNYIWVWIICILMAIVCLILICFRKKIMEKIFQ